MPLSMRVAIELSVLALGIPLVYAFAFDRVPLHPLVLLWAMAAVCLAVLRRDGFVSLDAGGERGTVTTRPFRWAGARLLANVKTADGGRLRAEVLDGAGKAVAATHPLDGDRPRGELRWAQAPPASLEGQPVRLRFTLRRASFYSYWLEP